MSFFEFSLDAPLTGKPPTSLHSPTKMSISRTVSGLSNVTTGLGFLTSGSTSTLVSSNSSSSTLLSITPQDEPLRIPSSEIVGKRWAAIYEAYYLAPDHAARLRIDTPPHEALEHERSSLILSYKTRLANAGAPYRRNQLHCKNFEEWDEAEILRRKAVKKALTTVVYDMRGIYRNNKLLFEDWESVANDLAKEFGLPGKVNGEKTRGKGQLTYLDLYQYGKLGSLANVEAGKVLEPELRRFKGGFAQGAVADPKKDAQSLMAYETAMCAAKDRRIANVPINTRPMKPSGILASARVVRKGRIVTIENNAIEVETAVDDNMDDEEWEDDDSTDVESVEDLIKPRQVIATPRKTYVYEWKTKKCIGDLVLDESSGVEVLGQKRPSLLNIGRSGLSNVSVVAGEIRPGYVRQVEGAGSKVKEYLSHRNDWFEAMMKRSGVKSAKAA